MSDTRPSRSQTFDPFELDDTLQTTGIPDPYPYLGEARRRAPVTAEWPLPEDLIPGSEPIDETIMSYCVLGHDEVIEVLRDHETYSSTILQDLMGPLLDRALIAMDEPMHKAHRALVAPAFRAELLARWEEEVVGRVVDEVIDSFVGDGRADLVRSLTFAFPVRVIARILGLPERDSEQFQRWSIEMISVIVNWDRGVAASQALREYFMVLVAERRKAPQDDLISEMLAVGFDGQRLDDEDIFAFLRLLLPAGVETTYRSFGNLLFALLTHPDQLEAVRRDPSLRPTAIEEALRWETPLVVLPRQTTRATSLAGVDIPAATPLNVFLGSANRDERRYEDPDRFDVRREQIPHASFGSGVHMCLGMHLARMETRVALAAVLERLPGLRLDPDAPPPSIVGGAFRSPDALPVLFDV